MDTGVLQKRTPRVGVVRRGSVTWQVVPWLVHFPACQICQHWTQGKAAGFSEPSVPICKGAKDPSITDLFIGLIASLCLEADRVGGVGISLFLALSLESVSGSGRSSPAKT